ncbi:MAG: cytochrome c [Sphingobacteriaceae bacterium]|nr:MAG: cytochrome c [Sphingobacteriaceae bacterium]
MKLTVVCFAIGILLLVSIFESCQSESELEYQRYYTIGKSIYQNQCQNCHAENGEGLGALIPGLQKADYLSKNKTKLACIIQNGQQGLIVVNGKFYNGKMPAQAQLAPIEIAEVITYVTNAFGNKQGVYGLEKITADLGKCGE